MLRFIRAATMGVWQLLLRLQEVILVATGLLLASNLFIDVIMRYVVRKPLLGIEELAPIFALWLYFIGGSYASYEHSHVYAGIMHVFLKNKQRAFAIMTVVATVVTLGLWCYAVVLGSQLLMWGIEKGQESVYLRLSMAYLHSSVFVGVILMSFYSLTWLIKDIRVCSLKWANVGKEGA